MDSEKLILSVQLKTPLWNQQSKEHHNRTIVKKLWDEVAKEMNDTSAAVKNKWRNLRDSFRKEFLKRSQLRSGDPGERKPKWAYFDMLLFLSDTITPRPASGNINTQIVEEPNSEVLENDEESQSAHNQIEEGSAHEKHETYNDNESFRTAAAQKRVNEHRDNLRTKRNKADIYEQLLQIEQQKVAAYSARSSSSLSGDSDYHFLMSLMPQLKQLAPTNNMQMRLNIQQLFLNEQLNRQSRCDHSLNNTPEVTVATPLPSPCETFGSSSTEASLMETSTPATSTNTAYFCTVCQETDKNVCAYFHSLK